MENCPPSSAAVPSPDIFAYTSNPVGLHSHFKVKVIYTYIHIYMMIIFVSGTGIWSGDFCRLGLSMGFSKLEFLDQIASFERRLRRAVPMPLTLPYSFRTSTTSTSMGAERDKRQVAKILYFGEVLSSLWLDLDVHTYPPVLSS